MAWPGGKDGAGVAQRLINEIPPHKVFVSAFLGDCAVLRRKRPAELSIGIDLDRENVERWAQSTGGLFSGPLELYCCDSIEWLRHRFGCYKVESPKSKVESPGCSASRIVATAAAVADNGGHADRLTRAQSLNHATKALGAENGGPVWVALGCDPAGLVAQNGGPSRSSTRNRGEEAYFVYADPPYLLSSRRSKGRLYAHELSDERHVELLATLVRLPCLVMVSHYPCDLYDSALAEWRSFTFAAQTRGGARATEKVWCNFEPPAQLHDARFLGLNKRQRERVRRRAKNWIARLARMHPLERQAVMDAIRASVAE